MASLFVEAALVSVYANVEALLICCAGVYAMHRQIVAPEGLRVLSRLVVEVLFPCIAFSNFRAYSWELLGEWYMAGVGSFLTMVLGTLLGKCGALLLRLEPPYSKIFILCTTFGNGGVLPFVLVPPIVVNWKPAMSDPESLYKAYGVISLYALVWNVALFGLGRPYALSMRTEKVETESEASQNRPCVVRFLQKLRKMDSVVWASILAIVVGCIAPVRDLLSERAGGVLRFVESFTYKLGSAGIQVSTLVLGGSLYLGGVAQLEKRRARVKTLRDAQEREGASPQAGVEAAVSQSEVGGEACCGLSPMVRLAVGATLIKLALVPAIAIPLIVLAVKAGATGRDQPMLFMVLMIQTGVPSAQTTLALLVSAGLQKVAGEMSIVYLPMYVASVATMAAIIMIAVTFFDTFDIDAPGIAGVDLLNATL
ncbi:unnamed protein product [Effrenium voratum]|uniref:Auxin efflux carrier n=1 Tax=Effrenium voratum TaxID=2562239 RepID=A0AA36HPF3_9DINO|nr:unnamed protein product [Effrenium voratum]